MKYLRDEKVKKVIFTGLVLIVAYFALYHIDKLWGGLKYLVNVFMPFILGAAIAFVLNVPLRWIERGLFKNRENDNDSWRICPAGTSYLYGGATAGRHGITACETDPSRN